MAFMRTRFILVRCAAESILGIKRDSSIWAWGRNDQGIFGNGTTTGGNYPQKTISVGKWRYLSVGNNSALGIQNSGTIWAWGVNNNGALGDSSWNSKFTPTRINYIKKANFCANGVSHSMVINDSGSLLTFGWNAYNQLGLGNATNYNSPRISIKGVAVKNFAIYRSFNLISDTATIGLVTNSLPNTRRLFIDTGLVNQNSATRSELP